MILFWEFVPIHGYRLYATYVTWKSFVHMLNTWQWSPSDKIQSLVLAWKYDTGQKLLENILSNQKTITKWHTLQYQKRHSKKQFSVCVVGLGKIRSYQLYVCQSFFFSLLQSGKILYSRCLKWEKSGSSLIKTFKLLSWR